MRKHHSFLLFCASIAILVTSGCDGCSGSGAGSGSATTQPTVATTADQPGPVMFATPSVTFGDPSGGDTIHITMDPHNEAYSGQKPNNGSNNPKPVAGYKGDVHIPLFNPGALNGRYTTNALRACAGKGICSSSISPMGNSVPVACMFQPGITPTLKIVFGLDQLILTDSSKLGDFFSPTNQPKTYAFASMFDISILSPQFAGFISPNMPGTIQLQPIPPASALFPPPGTTAILTFTITPQPPPATTTSVTPTPAP